MRCSKSVGSATIACRPQPEDAALDATIFELTFGEELTETRYRWSADAPAGWEPLGQFASRLVRHRRRARARPRPMTVTGTPSVGAERDSGQAIIALSRRYLREYLTKIRLAVSVLDDHVVWARPNEASNSIGNLMLHLAGNARQWIVSGVGGATRHSGSSVGVRPTRAAARNGTHRPARADHLRRRPRARVADAGRSAHAPHSSRRTT